jgi:D-amino-acid dehydrogenase
MRVVVVGAGIVGASAAYHLARRGVEVIVADRGDAGPATAAGAGIVGPWLSAEQDPDWYRLARAGACYYPRLVELLAEDGETELGHARVGGLVVHPDPAALEPAAQLLAARRAAAPDAVGAVDRIDSGEVRRLFPPLAPALHGIHVTGVSRVDGRLVRSALLRAAVRRGAVRRAGAVRLEPGGALVDGAPEPADAVVVAAGAWSTELCAPLGVTLAVRPQRGQIVHLQLSGMDTGGWPVVQPLGRQYLLAFPAGRIVVGATREDGTGFDHRVTAAGQASVLTEALAVAPGLSGATVVETRVGFRPVSGDGLALVGALPGAVRWVVATGMGPTGLTIGPYAGELAACLALGEDPGFDLAAYRPDRGTAAG